MLGFASRCAVLLSLLAVTACSPPSRWSQFHGDERSEGFIGTNSTSSSNELEFAKWDLSLSTPQGGGRVAYSSPVIGDDGTIYIGTGLGRLFAVRSDGTVKWTFDANTVYKSATIFSSPAVGGDGNIYFVVTRKIPAPEIEFAYRSALVSVDAEGHFRWDFSFDDGIYVTTSPKTRGSGQNILIFVASSRIGDPFLAIFNQGGQQIFRTRLSCPSDLLNGWPFRVNPKFAQNFDLDGPFKLLQNRVVPSDYGDEPGGAFEFWLDPTVAIVDSVRGTSLPFPIIVLSNCGIQAFELKPFQITRLWVQEKYQAYSSPAVSRDGIVVTGSAAGYVSGYDVETGRPRFNFSAGSPVLATPAFFLGSSFNTYVAAQQRLYVLDGDGTVLHQVDLTGPTVSSAALTLNGVYLSSPGKLHYFSFDLGTSTSDNVGQESTSSPAIANDGTLYSMTSLGTLRAHRAP